LAGPRGSTVQLEAPEGFSAWISRPALTLPGLALAKDLHLLVSIIAFEIGLGDQVSKASRDYATESTEVKKAPPTAKPGCNPLTG